MRKSSITPRNSERKFDISELFFSSTDPKGIIRSCNEVFVRVSAYESAQLLGQPHNTIRHPDMPRCVFKLLWDYLLDGRAVGAYVKNMAANGEYYWVFALAGPVDEGFLSIRLKPSSEIFTTVQKLYPMLLDLERGFGERWRAGMAASSEELHKQIRGLGFPSYDVFMGEALREEMISRNRIRSEKEEPSKGDHKLFQSLQLLVKLRDSLDITSEALKNFVFELELMAFNASVQAAHLGTDGHTLAVIGGEVGKVSTSITAQVKNLSEHVSSLTERIGEASFELSMASLQSEMSAVFVAEREDSNRSSEEEIALFGDTSERISHTLEGLSRASSGRALKCLAGLTGTMREFRTFCELLGRILMTLQFAYVTGKTESARIPGADGFSVLLDDLISLSEGARGNLSDLTMNVGLVEKTISAYRKSSNGTKRDQVASTSANPST